MKIAGDIEGLERVTQGLRSAAPAMERATLSALNKTARSSRSYTVKRTAERYRVSQKALRKEIELIISRHGQRKARLRAAGSPGVPLYKFKPTPRRVPSTKRTKRGKYTPRGGISIAVRKDHARKKIKGAFVAQMRSGHIGVFRREKKRKLPIKELFGPSPVKMLDAEANYDALQQFSEKEMEKNIVHDANYFLRKYGVFPNFKE